MTELLNLVGLSTGVALYAMLLTMIVRATRSGQVAQTLDPVLLTSALLGLVWNLCALPAYELPRIGVAGPFPWLIAIGYSALGLLAATVVHSVSRECPNGIHGALKRGIVTVAYGAGVTATVLHLRIAAAGGTGPSVVAMQLLTYTFVALVIPLAIATRRQPGARRALWIAALATFAVSALHLSQVHHGDRSWPIELLGHHASVPLAFALLYQDYPFALADLFLKRALALLILVATSFMAISAFGAVSAPFRTFVQADPRQVGALVTLWVATALVFPAFRRATAWFIDRVVLHRPDYRELRVALARHVQHSDDIPAMLSDVCRLLAPALSARTVVWHEMSGADGAAPARVGSIVVPTADAPQFVLVVTELVGGRRLLSDDVAMLDHVALVVARRIDTIRLTHERYERQLREQQMQTLASQAELRALRAQMNPHFLFNALTTIGYLIQTTPSLALETLMQLTSLLRAVLRADGEPTTLGRELDIIEAYLDIERARFEDRLRFRIEVAASLRDVRVLPLLIQPLVENAIKHGIGPLRDGGEVVVAAHLQSTGREPRQLVLTVHDTGAGATGEELARRRHTGVGLRNVERRLACQYGANASMTVWSEPGRGTTVSLVVPAEFVAFEDTLRRVV